MDPVTPLLWIRLLFPSQDQYLLSFFNLPNPVVPFPEMSVLSLHWAFASAGGQTVHDGQTSV